MIALTIWTQPPRLQFMHRGWLATQLTRSFYVTYILHRHNLYPHILHPDTYRSRILHISSLHILHSRFFLRIFSILHVFYIFRLSKHTIFTHWHDTHFTQPYISMHILYTHIFTHIPVMPFSQHNKWQFFSVTVPPSDIIAVIRWGNQLEWVCMYSYSRVLTCYILTHTRCRIPFYSLPNRTQHLWYTRKI